MSEWHGAEERMATVFELENRHFGVDGAFERSWANSFFESAFIVVDHGGTVEDSGVAGEGEAVACVFCCSKLEGDVSVQIGACFCGTC